MGAVRDNCRRLLDQMGQACARSGRDLASVRLVGITKRVDTDRIREAIESGVSDIGESRVQEAEQKLPLLNLKGVTCHLVGHLQSNKAGKAVSLFDCIQSLDTVSLARRLDQLALGNLTVLIQVKLGEEATKSGVRPEELETLIEAVHSSSRLRLTGLMGIPPFFEDPANVRPYFSQLRKLADEFQLPEVSMGMSHDFEVAIEEGATMIRVGTALFGERA